MGFFCFCFDGAVFLFFIGGGGVVVVVVGMDEKENSLDMVCILRELGELYGLGLR